MRTRGMTLLEVLIALTLLLAMAAVSLPAVLNTLDERVFTSASDLLKDQLLLARAYAQAEGVTVEVTYDSSSRLIKAKLFNPESQEVAFIDDADDRDEAEFILDPDEENAIPEGWAIRDLSDRLTLGTALPEDLDDPSRLEEEFDSAREEARARTSTTIRLVVFLPDGSALLSASVWLSDAHGREGQLGVSTYTGLPWFIRQAPSEALEIPDDENGDDEDQLLDESLPEEAPEPEPQDFEQEGADG